MTSKLRRINVWTFQRPLYLVSDLLDEYYSLEVMPENVVLINLAPVAIAEMDNPRNRTIAVRKSTVIIVASSTVDTKALNLEDSRGI